jgi:hypothetical protein
MIDIKLISTIDVAYQNSWYSTATIYAKFNGNDKTDVEVTPGCLLDAAWPYIF